MKLVNYIFICSILISCIHNKKPINDIDKIVEQVKQDTKIELPDFTTIEIDNSSTIGDYAKSLLVKFDSINFDILISRIKSNIKNGNMTSKIHIKDTEVRNIMWEPYESGYKIEIYFPKSNKRINYYVNIKNRSLFYLYVDE